MDSPSVLSRFVGRRAVVTGAGSGIGRAVALRLAEAGLEVIALDVREETARATAAEITERGHASAGFAVDVTEPHAIAALASEIVARFGAPSLVVASAGVSLRPLRPIWENSPEDWSWVMGVNFWGVVNTVDAFLPAMLELDGPRHVVTVNSMSQFRGMSGHSAYVTSKRAAEAYSECLAADVEDRGIGVTIVYPGRVRTGLSSSESLRPEAERSASRPLTALEIPAKSLENNPEREPDEIAEAIVAGVDRDERYVLTHQPPTEAMLSRLGRILGRPVTINENETVPLGAVSEG